MDFVYISDDDFSTNTAQDIFEDTGEGESIVIDMTGDETELEEDCIDEPTDFSQSIRINNNCNQNEQIIGDQYVYSDEELDDLPHFVSLRQLRRRTDAHSIRLLNYLEEHFIVPK